MPISFTIDPSSDRITTTMEGRLLDADPEGYLRELLAHPDYRPGMSALVVCREVRLGSYSTPGVRRLADFTRESESLLKASRVAVVAPQRAMYGLVRMYQFLRDPPYDLAVFRERSEAEAWLGEGSGGEDPEEAATFDSGDEEDA